MEFLVEGKQWNVSTDMEFTVDMVQMDYTPAVTQVSYVIGGGISVTGGVG